MSNSLYFKWVVSLNSAKFSNILSTIRNANNSSIDKPIFHKSTAKFFCTYATRAYRSLQNRVMQTVENNLCIISIRCIECDIRVSCTHLVRRCFNAISMDVSALSLSLTFTHAGNGKCYEIFTSFTAPRTLPWCCQRVWAHLKCKHTHTHTHLRLLGKNIMTWRGSRDVEARAQVKVSERENEMKINASLANDLVKKVNKWCAFVTIRV